MNTKKEYQLRSVWKVLAVLIGVLVMLVGGGVTLYSIRLLLDEGSTSDIFVMLGGMLIVGFGYLVTNLAAQKFTFQG